MAVLVKVEALTARCVRSTIIMLSQNTLDQGGTTMNSQLIYRKGFPYRGLQFSEDGCTAWLDGRAYKELQFSEQREKSYNRTVILVILTVFPGIMLLAYLGLQKWMLLFVPLVLVPFFLFDRKCHRCPRCNRTTRKITTHYDSSPVLFFCERCSLFFEHGSIDGGIPFPPGKQPLS